MCVVFLMGCLQDKKEGKIFILSRAMGLKMRTLIVFGYVMIVIATIFFWIPFYFAFKFSILKHSNLFIVFLNILLSFLAEYQSIIFYIATFGMLGAVLLALLNLLTGILGVLMAAQPLPGYINYPVTFISPNFGAGLNLQIALAFEAKYRGVGLQWSNITDEFY